MSIKDFFGFSKKKQAETDQIEEEVKESKEKQEEEKESVVPKSRKKTKIRIDKQALKKISLVVVAYSHVERDFFPTQESYEAEVEVEERSAEVVERIKKMGIPVKALPGDQYFLTNLLVDQPDIVLNLVDTLKGKDRLQTSVPAALELSNVLYNKAVKETAKDAQKKVDEMITTYRIPVIVEQFIDGPEVTVVVFDDGTRKRVYMAQKVFRIKPDGKHFFTSFESYDDAKSYTYKHVEEPLAGKIEQLAIRAFNGLAHKDYAKFDVRVDAETSIPYFTDSNPNTAFGPDMGLPMTEVLAMHGVSFDEVLAGMLTRYAKQIED